MDAKSFSLLLMCRVLYGKVDIYSLSQSFPMEMKYPDYIYMVTCVPITTFWEIPISLINLHFSNTLFHNLDVVVNVVFCNFYIFIRYLDLELVSLAP